MQKRSNTKSIIPGHASKKDLRKAKQELDLKEKIQTNLQDIILYVFFTFMLLFVVHSHRPVEKCFMQSQDINNIFIQNTLEHVSNTDKMEMKKGAIILWIHLFSWVSIFVDCFKLAYSWTFDFVILSISVCKAY